MAKKYGCLRIWAANITLALFYFYFAYNNFYSLGAEFKISILLLLIFNTSVILLAFIRRTPQAVTSSVFDYLVAFIGTLSPLLFLGLPDTNDHALFLALQVFGIGIALAGLVSLNRSFGLVAANRGIVTSGMYRFVRHPLYAGYVFLCAGFLLQNFSLRNLVAFTVFVIFESLRLMIEEQFLARSDEYKIYMKNVRWRVIPYIW